MDLKLKKRINHMSAVYVATLKTNVAIYCESVGGQSNVGEYIKNYPDLVFDDDDFVSKKRTTNMVDMTDRCAAHRANGEQCSRRRKKNQSFCGTHTKTNGKNGWPDVASGAFVDQTVEIWTQDINGIVYYIDAENNIYSPEDILKTIKNPRVIAQCRKNDDDVYSIVDSADGSDGSSCM